MNYKSVYEKLIANATENPPQGVCEVHHIIPRSLGGGNDRGNLISLTPRQHFIAHLLLAKIHGGPMWAALAFMSRSGTKSARGVAVSSRVYESIKINDAAWRSELYSGSGNPFFGSSHGPESLIKMRKPRVNKSGLFGRKVFGIGDVIASVITYKPRHVEPDLSLMRRIDESVQSWDTETKRLSSFYRRSVSISQSFAGRDYSGERNPNYGNGAAISGERNPMFGLRHSEETKNKIAEKAKRVLKCPHCGKESNIANAHRWHFDNCKHKDS